MPLPHAFARSEHHARLLREPLQGSGTLNAVNVTGWRNRTSEAN